MMPEGNRVRRWIPVALAAVVAACAATPSASPTASNPAVAELSPVPAVVTSPSPTATASGAPSPSVGPTPSGSVVEPSGSVPPTAPPPASPPASPDPSPATPGTSPELTAYWVGRSIPAAGLQRRLTSLARKYHLPGVSVTIRWPDGREWTGTAGVADVADKRPVTPETAFALASISKTYTAANAMKLVEEGHLALDDRASRYLPEFKLDPRITIRMLLDHTSGLPDFFLNRKIDAPLQGKPDQQWTPTRTWRYVRKLLFPPGTRWSYSNTNYMLLGMIEERADGRPLQTQIRARFLDPLGLDQTWTQVAEVPPTGVETTRGHRLLISKNAAKVAPIPDGQPIMPFRSVVTAAGGAGDIAATSRDAARWMAALVLGDVLEPATKLRMLSESIYTDSLGARIPYGLGVQVVRIRDRVAIGHSGRLLGYRGVVRALPEDGITIAVLTNQGTVDPANVASSMLKYILPAKRQCPTPTPTCPIP
jgi:D-alanyl-D-alanine carboxypeptidase